MIIFGLKVLEDREVFGKHRNAGEIIDVGMDRSKLEVHLPQFPSHTKPYLTVVELEVQEVK